MTELRIGQRLDGHDTGWTHRDIHLWLYQQTGIPIRGLGLTGHYEHHLEIGWWILDNDTGIEVRGDTKAMTLVNTEQKDAEPADALQFRAKTVGESMVFAPAVDLGHASETVIAVMEALVEIDTGGVAYTAWMDQAAERGVHERTFRRSQKWLVDNRQVVNVGSQKRPLWTVNSPDLDVTDGEF